MDLFTLIIFFFWCLVTAAAVKYLFFSKK